MAEHLNRCHNPDCGEAPHGHVFVAEHPVCPKCGLDGRTADGKDAVLRLLQIHLLVKAKDGPIKGMYGKRWACLCDPAIKLKHDGSVRATAEPSAVLCLACKRHPAFPKEFQDLTPELVPPWTVGKEIVEQK